MLELDYFQNLQSFINKNNTDVTFFANEIVAKINSGSSIWIMGNGGSASTAEHFETDLSYIKKESGFAKIKAFAITSNSSLITAIANDIGFDKVFSHQLNRKASKGDICFIISASGNSENLICAINAAKALGLETLAILGFDGGKIMDLADHAILIRSEIGEYGPVEDLHLAICHALAAKILKLLELKNV